MPFELRVHENPTQVRVSLETHAEHVPDFAFGPVGRLPQSAGRGNDRIGGGHLHFDRKSRLASQRGELVDDLESAVARLEIGGRDVEEHVERLLRVILEKGQDVGHRLGANDQHRGAAGTLVRGSLARGHGGSYGLGYFHSSAPLRQANTKPTARITMNTIISTKPNSPSSRNVTAHGYMNTTSTSKMMKRMATK